MSSATARLITQVWTVADAADAAARDYARLCLLDWLGVTVAGAQDAVVEVLLADCETRGAGHRLIGRSETTGLRDAVLINGAAGHALDYDDGMEAMMGHPSVAILPALVMLAAQRGIGGDRLLRAIVAGAEGAARIGLMLGKDHYFRGFHATGTAGAMGGAIGTAYLLGLDPARSAVALGLAATRAAGLKASFGTDAKPLHAGWAATIACTAALWAESGMTGASDVLSHAQGLTTLSGDFDVRRGLEPAGSPAEGPAEGPYVQTINFKYHAACAVTHPAIDGALRLQAGHGSPSTTIERIVLDVSDTADNICNIAAPASGLELKFSLRGVTAMALAGIDTASPDSFGAAPLADPEVRRIMALTEVRLDPARALGETGVTMDWADGTSASTAGSMDGFERDPALLRQRLGAKFIALVSPLTGSAEAASLLADILDSPVGPDARLLLPRVSA